MFNKKLPKVLSVLQSFLGKEYFMSNKENFFDFFVNIKDVIREIIALGGKPYLVGGSVRDYILNKDIKDVDIEVHGITLDILEECLKKFGKVKLVGKKFGVLRLYKHDIDWSLPRADSKGRKPLVVIDPNMTIEQACKRRDLTMNAMAIDLNLLDDIEIIDPYNGLKDLKDKKLKAVDEKLFLEDPLRFFRVMQFIGRFEMVPDENLNKICKSMSLIDPETKKIIAKERIDEEIKKLFLKSRRPSLGFRWLKEIGRLKELFPEIYDLISVKQRKDYHPEGNVFEHTMQSLDAAAIIKEYENESEKYLIMLGVLCHDLGKIVATDENLHCQGHDKAGVPLTRSLLKRFLKNKFLIDAVCKLVEYHTRPFVLLKQKSKLSAYKRLALKLAPQLNLRQLALVNLADVRGRNPNSHEPISEIYQDVYQEFLQKAENAKVVRGPEKPILLGRHLLDVITAGPEMGRLLKKAYEIQIEEGVRDWQELKKRVLK